MKRFKFGTKELQINAPLLNNIIDACLSDKAPTRNSVAAKTGASLTTVGKVLSALAECRFMTSEDLRPADGGRPCKHHTLNEMLSVLVIDLSSSDFSMTVIEGYEKCSFFDKA